jgi:hypothetical protein
MDGQCFRSDVLALFLRQLLPPFLLQCFSLPISISFALFLFLPLPLPERARFTIGKSCMWLLLVVLSSGGAGSFGTRACLILHLTRKKKENAEQFLNYLK